MSCSFRYHKDAARLVGDCGGSKALEKYMAEVYKLQYNDVPQYSKLRKIFEDHLQGHDPKTTLEWLHPKAKAKPAKANKVNGMDKVKMSATLHIAHQKVLY